MQDKSLLLRWKMVEEDSSTASRGGAREAQLHVRVWLVPTSYCWCDLGLC